MVASEPATAEVLATAPVAEETPATPVAVRVEVQARASGAGGGPESVPPVTTAAKVFVPPGEAPLPLASPTLSPVLTPASTARPAPPLSDPALARPGGPGTSTPAIGTEAVLKNEVLLKQLDKLKEEVSAKPGLTAKVAGTVTVGAAVSVGYLLLTGRALLWLLLALTARSTWKQFDPLEIDRIARHLRRLPAHPRCRHPAVAIGGRVLVDHTHGR